MAISIKISKEGLKIVDQARKKKGWSATAAAWCSTANTSLSTLKRFREGKAIQQDSFISICQAVGIDWQQVINDNISQTTETSNYPNLNITELSFFAYDHHWVGRTQLLIELKQKITEQIRTLIITGITGIGKTAISERLIDELLREHSTINWKKFICENFDNQTQTSDFASIAVKWLTEMGETVTPEEQTNIQQLLNRLLKQLLENRYLLLMDSLEIILKGNEEEGWSDFEDQWWVEFFEGLLSANNCQSLVILTSQDFPAQIPYRYQKFWYCQSLTGLSQDEQLALFLQTGLEIEHQEYAHYLTRIGAAYEGHPLALRVIAGEIGDQPFYGNVIAYWNQYGQEIEEVEKAIAEAKTQGITTSTDDQWKLHQYTHNLRKKVQLRLKQTLNRLKKDFYFAYVLLCQAAVFRCPVKAEFWLEYLEDWDLPEKWEGDNQELLLDILRDRYLLEEIIDNNQCLVRQHNLIRSIALEGLKQLDQDYEQCS